MTGMVDLRKHMSRNLKGNFWLPSVGTRRPGHLKFDENSIRITIFGSLSPNPLEELDKNVTAVIHCELQGLGAVTLFDSRLLDLESSESNSDGTKLDYVEQVFRSKAILVSATVNHKSDIEFNKVVFHIGDFDKWADEITGFAEKRIEKKTVSLTYKAPLEQKFALGEEDKLLSIETDLQGDLSKRNVELAERLVLGISKEEKEAPFGDLDDAIRDIESLKKLFSLFIGDNVVVREMELQAYNSDIGEYEQRYQYFTVGHITPGESGEKHKIPISFSEIKGEFEGILKNWVKFKKDNDYILDRFFKAHSINEVQSILLSYVQFMEAFNREGLGHFDDESIKGIANGNNKVAEEELSLWRRLELSIDEFLSDKIKELLGIDVNFVKRVARMRNDWAHLNRKAEDWGEDELDSASQKLKTVIRIIILRVIGLRDELLLGGLEETKIEGL